MAQLAQLTSFREGDRRKVITTAPKIDHWKRIFLSGFNSMFLLNLFAIFAFIPVLALGYRFIDNVWQVNALLPFSSAFGTGILSIVDAGSIQHKVVQASFVENILMYMPLAIIVTSTFCGAFVYGLRNAEYDGRVVSYKSIFKGFKLLAGNFFVLGIITAILASTVSCGVFFFREYFFVGGWCLESISILVGTCIVGLFSVVFMLYAYTISATYKMTIPQILHRAFKFTINLALQNIVVLIVSLAPFALALLSSFLVSLVFTMAIFVGFSFVGSIWMVYIQHVLSLATPQSAKKSKK